MKIVLQNFKTGKLSVSDMPEPSVPSNGVLVRTHSSLISAGTDRSIINLGRKSSIGKALDRPDLARKVINRAKTEGLWSTYQVVKNLIAEPIPLGYSLVGTVIGVGREVRDIALGDRVAGAGLGYANHAEVVAIPRNLVASVPSVVTDEQAAYVTIGAIAMHGLRQADQQLGATVVVFGLGLVGLSTVQLAAAAGLKVIGVDLSSDKLTLARGCGAAAAFQPDDPSLPGAVKAASAGYGADAVLLTAGSRDSGKIFEDAAQLCRDRARVVVVGDIKMDLSRRSYFEKEIEIVQSRSYGPGRYDPDYENKGQDYPIGYVRWTERRNMECFLQLVASERIDPSQLTSHRFPIDQAERAYDLVMGKVADGGSPVGIVLAYPPVPSTAPLSKPAVLKTAATGPIGLGLIGSGQFTKGILLPAILGTGKFALKAVASAKGLSAKAVADRYGAGYGGAEVDRVLDDEAVRAIVIGTRHGSHAYYIVEALKRGKHVFVEKPLAIDESQLRDVEAAIAGSAATIQVGYNRRFAPMIQETIRHFQNRSEPLTMSYRINAGRIPLKSEMGWVHDVAVGGGRIVGEACHFVDVLQALTQSTPIEVSVEAANAGRADLAGDDTVTLTIRFDDGSIGTVHYWANGDPSYPKERFEAFGGERIAVLDNFRRLELVAGGKVRRSKALNADKGFANEANAFAEACRTGVAAIPIASLIATTQVTLAARDAIYGLGTQMDD